MLINSKHEYVYLLEEVESPPTHYVKIGSTGNYVDARIGKLQTGNARKLKLCAALKTAVGESLKIEKELQNKFNNLHKECNGGTEWFRDISYEIRNFFRDDDRKIINEELKNFKFWKEKYEEFSTGLYQDTFKFVESEVVSLINKNVNVVVLAPPKSGKKIMVQSAALLLPIWEHIYLTAQDKNDMKDQLEEYKPYEVTAIPVVNKSGDNQKLKKDLLSKIGACKNNQILIHFDECDFGSGIDGMLGKFIDQINTLCKDNNNTVRYISYSATPEEAIFSDHNYHLAHFKPSVHYNGPDFYINNNLCCDPQEFFNSDNDNLLLTDQAKEILSGQLISDKPFQFCVSITKLVKMEPLTLLRKKTNYKRQSILNMEKIK